MKRPAAVTASAVVCILGSVLVLAGAAAALAASYGPPPPTPAGGPVMPNMPSYGNIMLGASVMLAAFGALGISTAIGLLKLRPWARISTLVFAGVMATMSAIAGVAILMMPLPATPGLDSHAASMVRPILAAVYGIPLLVGVWWLVQFNRPATKAAFGEGMTAGGPAGRPLSISIIGWWMLVSGALCILPAFSNMPSMFFGVLLTGWAGTLMYVVFAAVQISAGTGLLKLQEPARILTIAWLGIMAASLAVTAWRPGISETLNAYWRQVGAVPPTPQPIDIAQFMRAMTPFWLLISAVPIWFLVRRRSAFHGHANG